MSKGYPDFFGQGIYLKYGPMQRMGLTTITVNPGATEETKLTGVKGTFVSGHVAIYSATDPVNVTITFYLDSVAMMSGTIWQYFHNRPKGVIYGPFEVSRYDREQKDYVISLVHPISFDDGMRIVLANADSAILTWNTDFYYSRVIA